MNHFYYALLLRDPLSPDNAEVVNTMNIFTDARLEIVPNNENLTSAIKKYTNDYYCKAILVVGKALSAKKIAQLLDLLQISYEPQPLSEKFSPGAEISCWRLAHTTHLLLASPKYSDLLAAKKILDLYAQFISADRLMALSRRLGALCRDKGWTLATAESCTGGGISAALTAASGASNYFKGSVCAYSAAIKEAVLGVPADIIERHGVVSTETAEAMALGAQRLFTTTIALSTTGVAGPGPDDDGNPEGLVCTCVRFAEKTQTFIFEAGAYSPLLDRDAIRQGCTIFLLEKSLDWLIALN
ncbi:MAG: CinA family protein [Peptococcaceae bacterium]|nr:CinA family protein [Peptococcaceae bacterium]